MPTFLVIVLLREVRFSHRSNSQEAESRNTYNSPSPVASVSSLPRSQGPEKTQKGLRTSWSSHQVRESDMRG